MDETVEPEKPLPVTKSSHTTKRMWYVAFVLLLVTVVTAAALYTCFRAANEAPSSFIPGTVFTVTEGMSQRDTALLLEDMGLIRSPLVFYAISALHHEESFVQAGSYLFDAPMTTFEIVTALMQGTHLLPPIAVTFPEGFTVKNLSRYLPEIFKGEDTASYIEYEGYLFPDTYFVAEDSTLDELILRMREHFDTVVAPFQTKIDAHDLSLDEIVTLASIVEREGNTRESMQVIAGILLTRLDIGMPLQVDATFDYLLGKESAELTLEDLEIDSPYNTYNNLGLPPTPIANPGLVAIEAVLEPEITEYLYYLTGTDGNFHYAETFEEHKQNKARYLR